MNAIADISLAAGHSAFDAITHGPFLVEPDGVLRLEPARPPRLRFAWRGQACEARIAEGVMRFTAAVGAVPYTAMPGADRPAALAAVGALPAELPSGWLLRLLPDHRVKLDAERALPAPITATALVTALVGFALALDPYLDRLESAGLASGSVNT